MELVEDFAYEDKNFRNLLRFRACCIHSSSIFPFFYFFILYFFICSLLFFVLPCFSFFLFFLIHFSCFFFVSFFLFSLNNFSISSFFLIIFLFPFLFSGARNLFFFGFNCFTISWNISQNFFQLSQEVLPLRPLFLFSHFLMFFISFFIFPNFSFFCFLKMCFFFMPLLAFVTGFNLSVSSVVGAPWRCGVLTTARQLGLGWATSTWERACFNSPEWGCGSSSPVKTDFLTELRCAMWMATKYNNDARVAETT